MEEGTESNDSLSWLLALEYGKHPNALLDLATTITEDINEQHELELVLDTAKADESTQANLERHLSLLEISQNNQHGAEEQRTPSLKDLEESHSQSSPTMSVQNVISRY